MNFTSKTIHVDSETSSNGVVERTFTLGDITGVLWSPASTTAGPLMLLGHAGGMHKKAPGLVASALHSVTVYGFTVAAIDAPGHGDRPRSPEDQRWVDAIHRARTACEPIAPIVIDYSASLAERAVPEWRATLDALQALPEVGSETPVGYGGVSSGAVTGVMLTASEPRIAALSLGGIFVGDALIGAARMVTVPVEYRTPWDGEEFDREAAIALFDAFASKEKVLHARSGGQHQVPYYERDSSCRFLLDHLGPRGGDGVSLAGRTSGVAPARGA